MAQRLQRLDAAMLEGGLAGARNLALQLENPVLLRNIAQQLAEALTTDGQLQETGHVLEQAPAAASPDDGIAAARAQLALERGEPVQALAVRSAAPATDADSHRCASKDGAPALPLRFQRHRRQAAGLEHRRA